MLCLGVWKYYIEMGSEHEKNLEHSCYLFLYNSLHWRAKGTIKMDVSEKNGIVLLTYFL
jgi:hypothetical protein